MLSTDTEQQGRKEGQPAEKSGGNLIQMVPGRVKIEWEERSGFCQTEV